ncbi:F-box only protein 16 isoform X2 [Hemicordylus capensis]|uniref:F-box only protein 16 isoform X2 n=1 Tax=Hemicordylus capensis TaxID=884348 RepID=UPI002304005D|nr:F-box only protein 16 isoform X2 [Hemicordylus capensis]
MQTWELGHVLLSTLNLLNCCIFYRKEMAFAPPKNPESRKMQTKMSTWTPLNHQLMNGKVFEERRNLLGKWFDKWTDGQRRSVLMDLLERCSPSQLKFFAKQLQDRVPAEALDFTRRLPRALSLYIFSFLDPRSLSRCAQVSWHWKYLTELDQVWMRKCLRYGWYINFSPTPFEQGIWKRHYIEMVKELQVTPPKTPPKYDFVVVDVQPVAKEVLEMKPSLSSVLHSASLLGKKMSKDKRELPPWRSSDKHPTDTIRFNYLDNFDPIEEARQARKKGGGLTPDLGQLACQEKRKPGSGTYKLRKAKSLRPRAELPRTQECRSQMALSADFGSQPRGPARPSWATHQSTGYPVTKATAKILAQSAQWNAGIRPAPVRGPVPKLSEKGKKAFARTSRSSPTPLFESQPWQVPASSRESDAEQEDAGRGVFTTSPLH